MDFRRLQYFVVVAENLNFTAAARQLGIAQPPLSVHIRKLEEEIGGPLFHRDGKVRLTPLGILLLDEARSLLQSMSDSRERMLDAAAGRSGQVRVGFTAGGRTEKIAKRFRKFCRKNREARIDVSQVVYNKQLISEKHHWDLLITDTNKTTSGAVILDRGFIRIAVPPKHRLADRSKLAITDLTGEPLLLSPFSERSAAEEMLATMLRDEGRLELVQAPSGIDQRLWQVSCGVGLAVCTDLDSPTFNPILIPLEQSPEILVVGLPNEKSRSPILLTLLESLAAA